MDLGILQQHAVYQVYRLWVQHDAETSPVARACIERKIEYWRGRRDALADAIRVTEKAASPRR